MTNRPPPVDPRGEDVDTSPLDLVVVVPSFNNMKLLRACLASVERDLADSWADRMAETAEKDPKSLILVIADMARSNPPMVSAFVAELARRLQGRGPALALPLTERAALAQTLWASLDHEMATPDDDSIMAEVLRRDAELTPWA